MVTGGCDENALLIPNMPPGEEEEIGLGMASQIERMKSRIHACKSDAPEHAPNMLDCMLLATSDAVVPSSASGISVGLTCPRSGELPLLMLTISAIARRTQPTDRRRILL
jgi:hypothetical protein